MIPLWHKTLRLAALATAVGVVGLLLIGAARMVGPGSTPIRWIEVSGPFERVSADQVRLAAAAVARDGYFAVDPEQVREHVAQIPWVSAVAVSKQWPDTVLVRIVEHQALARWGEAQLVSLTGDLFEVGGDSEFRDLPHFHAEGDKTLEVIEFYHQARDLLAGTGLDVTAIDLSPRGAWSLDPNRRIAVEIGSEEPLARLERFIESLPQLGPGAETALAGIDLRYANGFAVRWTEPEPELLEAAYIADEGAP